MPHLPINHRQNLGAYTSCLWQGLVMHYGGFGRSCMLLAPRAHEACDYVVGQIAEAEAVRLSL
jgi:hypothetical protein